MIDIISAAEPLLLRELDCDWDEASVSIQSHMVIKINQDGVWGYHAYTGDLNQDGKPDYLLHKTYATCGKYAGYAKIIFLLSGDTGYTRAEIDTLDFSTKDVFCCNKKLIVRQTFFDERLNRRATRNYSLSEIQEGKCLRIMTSN